ncbi:hypothetical protein B0H13DRAFT_1935030 [Mycena leptocephala]|nr:hypothetical protein B0H13DRAFT_1935030 [Mycena leptocephala]
MLNSLNFTMNRGLTPLMLHLPEKLSGMDDHYLQGQFITEAFQAMHLYPLLNPEMAIDEGIRHIRLIQDPDAEASYYFNSAHDITKAEDFYGRALSVASQCSSDTSKVRPLGHLALMALFRGNHLRALQLAQETYRIARASGNIEGELKGIHRQAQCYGSMGDFTRCIQVLEEGKEMIIGAGLQGGLKESLLMNTEAELYQIKTEYSDARRVHEAILHQTSAVLSPVEYGHALLNIAFLDVVTGASTDVVSRKLDAAIALFRNTQYSRGISLCEHCHADLLLREGDATGARVEYMRIFAAAYTRDNELACYCLERLADPKNTVHAGQESARWAIVFFAFALRPRVRSTLTVHQALRRLGDVLVRQGADQSALNILNLALEGFTRMDVHQSRAECMRTMGDVYVQRGDLCRAKQMWESARPLFERSEQKKEVARVDEKLQTLGVTQKSHDISKI